MAVNDYATLAEFKAQLPNTFTASGVSDTTYDAFITLAITNASRAIDKLVGKKPGSFFVNADVTRYFDGMSRGFSSADGGVSNMLGASAYLSNVSLEIDELAAAPTSVAVSQTGDLTVYTPFLATDYILWPYNALDDGRPYTRLDLNLVTGTQRTWYGFRKGVQIVGKFGYSTVVPGDVKQAMLIQSVRWFKRALMNWADLGVITDSGQLAYQNKLDSDVEITINHYRDMVL